MVNSSLIMVMAVILGFGCGCHALNISVDEAQAIVERGDMDRDIPDFLNKQLLRIKKISRDSRLNNFYQQDLAAKLRLATLELRIVNGAEVGPTFDAAFDRFEKLYNNSLIAYSQGLIASMEQLKDIASEDCSSGHDVGQIAKIQVNADSILELALIPVTGDKAPSTSVMENTVSGVEHEYSRAKSVAEASRLNCNTSDDDSKY